MIYRKYFARMLEVAQGKVEETHLNFEREPTESGRRHWARCTCFYNVLSTFGFEWSEL